MMSVPLLNPSMSIARLSLRLLIYDDSRKKVFYPLVTLVNFLEQFWESRSLMIRTNLIS